MKAMKDLTKDFGRKDFGRNVSRVQFIDIIVPTAWLIDGELWRFRPGTELFIGPQNDLDAAQPVVIACVALSLINAGKAQPSDTTALEEFDMEEFDMEEFDMEEFDMEEFDMEEFDMEEFDMEELG